MLTPAESLFGPRRATDLFRLISDGKSLFLENELVS